MTKRYQFTDEQRARLRELGLIDEQIDRIEAVALPYVRSFGRPPARLDAVRAKMKEVRQHAHALALALERLSPEWPGLATCKPEEAAALNEARFLLGRAHGRDRTLPRPPPMDALPDMLTAEVRHIDAIAERALARARKTQTRSRLANTLPIEMIDEAMRDGWAMRYSGDVSVGWRLLACRDGIDVDAAMAVKRSSSPGSAYREIMGICYEAARHPTADPERAIKAFLRHEKEWLKRIDWPS